MVTLGSEECHGSKRLCLRPIWLHLPVPLALILSLHVLIGDEKVYKKYRQNNARLGDVQLA